MNLEEKSKEPIAINGEKVEVESSEVNSSQIVGCLMISLVIMGIWAGIATGIAFMALR